MYTENNLRVEYRDEPHVYDTGVHQGLVKLPW